MTSGTSAHSQDRLELASQCSPLQCIPPVLPTKSTKSQEPVQHKDTRPGPQAANDATSSGHVPRYPSELSPKAAQSSERPLPLARAAHTSTQANSISNHEAYEGNANISKGAPTKAMIPEPDASNAAPTQEPASIRPRDPSARPLKQVPPPKQIPSNKKPEMDNHTLLTVETHLCADPGLMNDLLETCSPNQCAQ
jgi:hypothetical protein